MKAQNQPKHYVQFSKRVVVAVTASVTAICLAALVLCTLAESAESVVLVVQAYIGYAIVVFAAYSGNSAVEKWLIRKYKNDLEEGE